MDKKAFKQVKKQLKEAELQAFKASLPMDEKLFVKLFEFLAKNLAKKPCKHTLHHTNNFLLAWQKPSAQIFPWLHDHGGYCDCEVLNNVAEYFYYQDNTWDEPYELTQDEQELFSKKQKIKSVNTDFGFAINSVPAPWQLLESVNDTPKAYYFQMGKKMSGCYIKVIHQSLDNELHNDDFFIKLYNAALSKTDEKLSIERGEWERFYWLSVTYQNSTVAKVWAIPKANAHYHLLMTSELPRIKGDLKELEKLT
ncbi:MAG: DUF2695 domain-containing protein, partial [Capnocytophaga sp.]|nr:DUF2695 domain-containing protein [Capnocytophaga sp.]